MLKISLSPKKKYRLLKLHSANLLAIVKSNLIDPKNSILLSYFSSDKVILEVLTAKPDDLVDVNAKVWKALTPHGKKTDIHNALKRTFSPTIFFSKKTPMYNAYHLCQYLDQKTCPYCNLTMIPTVIMHSRPKQFVYRPPLDHFHPSSLYPLLAVSFFNLIPSCDTCNGRFKRAIPTLPTTHLNPYVAGFDDNCIFNFSGFKKIDDILAPGAKKFQMKLKNLTGDPRFNGNAKLFKLNAIYSSHKEIARDALVKARNYSNAQIRSISALGLTYDRDPYELVFSSKFNLEKLHERSYSKLNRDIVRKYGSTDLKTVLGL